MQWQGQSGSGFSMLNHLTWSLCCKATERSRFQHVWWGCFVYGFGVEPFSNHHHSSLDMSKTWGPCGKLQRWVIAAQDAFSCCTETWCTYKRNTLSISLWFPMRLQLPQESVILSKLSLAPQNDLYANGVDCFSYKHQWLIVPFTRGTGAVWLRHLEWMSNFTGCLERSQGDLTDTLGLWLGTDGVAFAFSSDRWCDPNKHSGPVSLLWQRTAAQPSQHPRKRKHKNVWLVMIAQHRCFRTALSIVHTQVWNSQWISHMSSHTSNISQNAIDNQQQETKQIHSSDSDVQNICRCWIDRYHQLLCEQEEKPINIWLHFSQQTVLNSLREDKDRM